ncbi:MAG: NYN domain-containing protein [Bacteroidia bacterium]|nr:NYN domain-containing protein [Bacteroidia bacterium]
MEFKKTYIDGYNVLRKISRLERLMHSNGDAARRGFIDFVRKRSRNLGHVVVVFDGHGESIGGGPKISTVYSLTRTADSWIRQSLERDRHPRMVLVVSSDNEIRAHALACEAEVMSAKEFIDEGTPVDREENLEQYLKNRSLSEAEIATWLHAFGEASAKHRGGGAR